MNLSTDELQGIIDLSAKSNIDWQHALGVEYAEPSSATNGMSVDNEFPLQTGLGGWIEIMMPRINLWGYRDPLTLTYLSGSYGRTITENDLSSGKYIFYPATERFESPSMRAESIRQARQRALESIKTHEDKWSRYHEEQIRMLKPYENSEE